jgi:hypothetical protein
MGFPASEMYPMWAGLIAIMLLAIVPVATTACLSVVGLLHQTSVIYIWIAATSATPRELSLKICFHAVNISTEATKFQKPFLEIHLVLSILSV